MNLPDMSTIKARFHVPRDLVSCHRAIIDGYIVEAHVPAHAIQRLLAERPHAVGLAVPGMPVGSPADSTRQSAHGLRTIK